MHKLIYLHRILALLLILLLNPAASASAAPLAQAPTSTVNAALKAQADQLSNQGNTRYRQNDLPGATGLFKQALPLYHQARDTASEAATGVTIGLLLGFQHDYAQAQPYYQQAIMLFHTLGDTKNEAAVLDLLGDSYLFDGHPAKAVDIYRQAVALETQLNDKLKQAKTLGSLGAAYQAQGQHALALTSYQQSLALYNEVNDPDNQTFTLTGIALVYKSQGDYARALDAFQQALKIAQQQKNQAAVATILLDIGSVYEDQGQYPQSLDNYQHALTLTLALTLTGPSAADRIYNNLGAVYDDMGEYGKALASYEQALKLARQNNAQTTVGSALNNLGVLYERQGQYAKALDNFNQYLNTARASGNIAGQATAYINLASIYQATGDPGKAIENLAQARSIFHTLGNPLQEAGTLNNLGTTYQDQGNNAKASDSFQQALTLERSIGHPIGEATTLSNIGSLYQGQNDSANALIYYRQALEIQRKIGDIAGQATSLSNMGYAYEQQGDSARALDNYRQAIELRERLRSSAGPEELKTSLTELSAPIYQRAVRLLVHVGQPAEAFALSERARARTFLDQLGNARLNVTQGADPQQVAQETSLRQQLAGLEQNLRQARSNDPNSDAVKALATQLDVQQKDYSDLLVQMKVTSPEYASLVAVSPLTVTDTQKLLDEKTTLLAFFLTSDKTLAFVVTRSTLHVVELTVSPQDLAAAIAEFRDFASLDDPNPPNLKKLYGWLLAPLKDTLQTPIIGIIPNGVLHYLPFAALSDGQQTLGDNYTLFYLPSASVLPFIEQKRKGDDNTLLAVAQGQVPGLPLLHFANQEAENIAGIYGGQTLIGQNATKSAFTQKAGNFSLLHVAAHGILNTRAPLLSQIALAADNQAEGALTVQEVYSLNLPRTNMVVLSACETQIGALSQGDDLIGLSRAFIYAGTPSVLASLWTVDDQATSDLMRAFYTYLKAGMSKADALRTAQHDLKAKYPHPYYWAGFVLTGDPGVSRVAPATAAPATAAPVPAQVAAAPTAAQAGTFAGATAVSNPSLPPSAFPPASQPSLATLAGILLAVMIGGAALVWWLRTRRSRET